MATTSASSATRSPWFLAAISRVFGIHFAPVNVPLERRLQTFAVLFWMSTFLFMGSGYLVFLTYLFFYTQYWWVTVAYVTWFFGDRSICRRGGRRWKWVRNWKLWKHYRDFFPMKVVKTAELDPSKNYIMGYHPHGILSAGAFALFATEGLDFSKLFPGMTPYLLTLEAQFLLPFYREFLLCFGTMSSSREGMDYLLGGEGTGNALCLVIGGAKEALDCHPGEVTLFLKKRLGFCKMAIRHGASLVPMFGFGENDIYDQVPNPEGSLTRRLQNGLQKLTGWAPCVFFGRGVFQYSFGFIPFRKPVTVVVGEPIDVEQVRDPSEEEVRALHTKYVDALTKLFHDHREAHSRYPNRTLRII